MLYLLGLAALISVALMNPLPFLATAAGIGSAWLFMVVSEAVSRIVDAE